MPKQPKRKSPANKNSHSNEATGQRLQKVLAAAGHGSRRACEELILAGRVDVDGKTADELGTRVDPTKQVIRVDGVPLPRQRFRYYLLNKPTGVVCTNRDPSGRTRVIDLVPNDQRLFTVGRLDLNSEGLILVTNDGDLANQLAHPRYGVEKLYEVEVAGKPEPEQLRQLRAGIHLSEAFVKVEAVKVKRRRPKSTLLEITLREGRNREIRRILARIGHKVLRLRRVAMGPFRLAKLPSGAYRELTSTEVAVLQGSKPAGKRKAPKKKATPKKATKKATKKPTKQTAKASSATSAERGSTKPKKKPAKKKATTRKSATRSRVSANKTIGKQKPAKKKKRGRR